MKESVQRLFSFVRILALVNDQIEALLGPAAQDGPGADEWVVWQGATADEAEALQSAEKAIPRVDLEWIRIRYERDLDIRQDPAWSDELPSLTRR